MMAKLTVKLAILLSAFGYGLGAFPASATLFDQQEISQQDVIAIARPYGNGKYDLLILQQFPGKRQCWSVNGANPGIVAPLLLDFDFTGSCERSTDSNGYSIRLDGQDRGLDYLLRVVERNGELVLVGTPRDGKEQEMIIGRTRGRGTGLLQIYLVDGWRFTKRTFEGRTLSHIYLTGDSAALVPPSELMASNDRVKPSPASIESKSSPTESKPANPSVREYTFTAPGADARTPEPLTGSQPPRVPLTPRPDSAVLPPPPPVSGTVSGSTSGTASLSNRGLPPLAPSPANSDRLVPNGGGGNENYSPAPLPPATNSNRIVPPPPPRNVGNRRTLSDVIAFNRSTPASNPQPNPTQETIGNRFKVVIDAKTEGDRSKVRSLYPDAFRTSYKGKSFWQIGVFTSRDKAESALQSLTPLPGSIVPF